MRRLSRKTQDRWAERQNRVARCRRHPGNATYEAAAEEKEKYDRGPVYNEKTEMHPGDSFVRRQP